MSGILAHIFSRYFNSHAHVERDMIIWQHFRNMRISTHTLTWSVTNDTLYKYLPCFISTHTLTWSVTWSGKSCIAALFISTHTLTWSVTRSLALRVCSTSNFNSHAHVERDEQVWIPGKPHRHFNSHAHVERDYLYLLIFVLC